MKSSVGRPRSAGRRDLPDNLTPRHRGGVVYWYWRDPRDKLEKSLKCPDDKATAIRRATELNAIVAQEFADRLIDGLAKSRLPTPFDAFAHHCMSLWTGLAPNTLKSRKSLLNKAIREWGNTPILDIGVPEVAALLRKETKQGKDRTAQALRSTLAEVWQEAHQEGVIPSSHPNPAKIARNPSASVKRARLELDTFNAVLAHSQALGGVRGEWMPNSLLLGLTTGQRLSDVQRMQFRKGRDWQGLWKAWQERNKGEKPYPCIDDGYLWVVQQKGGALVQIPLALRLDAIGLSVGDVIDRCRSKVVSRYVLHHTRPFGNAPVGSSVSTTAISRGFKDARRLTDLEWSGKTPPTFHEIRSLSERLYRAQGVDTQALLGHKHARMTEVYADPRKAAWTVVLEK